MDEKEVFPDLLKQAEHTETTYQLAHKLSDIRERLERIEILVEWEGLPDNADET
eukprot:IDg5264t1